MISNSTRELVKQELEKLEKPISLKVFTTKDCPTGADTVALCRTLAELSEKIRYEEFSLTAEKEIAEQHKVEFVPTILIDGSNIRYTGLPAGGEFSTFINTLIMVSTGKTELAHVKQKLMEIKKPVAVQTIITST
ncbi:MAG: thioredoxin family protein [Promethearchaeota archaeon]